MTNKTSDSSNSLLNPEPGATDSPWQPSWWRWLISALSGTVEIERQDALEEKRHAQRMNALRKSNEELRKSNEEFKKNSEELKSENKRLAELESKIDGLFSKHGIKLSPATKPEQP
ncbi:hypothetical protein VB780_16820 [Leptolyngbya sp. CCNP1308]|uniref:hypothetical protein n=1 Tax=Leptolyngbya sp. CCNP1308 TaxID=3110255 RepID=UPI002B21BC38|nr:hypothetical protein [Leptolyngbya sp. CCNP1308]MEA5450246.1 hypothetical protein [Leptolyngbya sp. CCNP1308]